MRRASSLLVGVLVSSAVGCTLGTLGARTSGPPIGPCVVPVDEGGNHIRVTDESRRACVAMARLIEPPAQTITHEDLRSGHPAVHR
jgi:hypothetical protein